MEGDLFGAVPDAARRALLAVAVRRRFVPGEVVFHEGDPADTLSVVLEGHLAVRRVSVDGNVVTLAVLGPGDLVGEMALLSPQARRTTTVAALEPVVTLAFGFGDVDALRRRDAAVDRVLLDLLATRVRRLSDHLVEALYLPADQRVVSRLDELCATYGERPDGTHVLPLTQTQIGELAGASRPVTNQVLRALAATGVVRLGRGAVTVLDRGALRGRPIHRRR